MVNMKMPVRMAALKFHYGQADENVEIPALNANESIK